MTDKQIIFNCDVDCIHKNTEECFELECIYGQESILKQLARKEQECETLASQLDFEVQKKECLEQECERLNNIINVAKNSKLDLKSFLVGEAVQNEYEEQLDQLNAENEELKQLKDEDSLRVTRLAMENTLLQKKFEESEYARGNELIKLVGSKTQIEAYKQVIEKVRELCQKDKDFCVICEGDGNIDCIDCTEGGKAKLAVQILRICDEVNGETTNN